MTKRVWRNFKGLSEARPWSLSTLIKSSLGDSNRVMTDMERWDCLPYYLVKQQINTQ